MKIKALQVGDLGTNCYILADETAKLCAVVDPGGDARRIASAVEQMDCRLCAIFLTHGHYDHTGGAEELASLWPDVPGYLNRRDANPDTPYMAQLFPVIPNVKDYDEGDEIAVGGLTVTVMATPGHSEGSVTLRCGDVLFCGDTLFAGSCGRTDFPGGSMQKILKSLKRLAQLKGNLQVLPGHMDLSDLDHERRTNPYVLHALERA